MQPGRRRGHRSRRPRVHGLVTFPVQAVGTLGALDVRRQRHLPGPLGRGRGRHPCELHPAAALGCLEHGRGDAVLEVQPLPGAQGLAGPVDGGRRTLGRRFQQEQLDTAAAVLGAEQSRAKDLGVVGDQHGSRLQQLGQVAEPAMLERRTLALHHHQTRSLTTLGRMLGDQLRRQRVLQRPRPDLCVGAGLPRRGAQTLPSLSEPALPSWFMKPESVSMGSGSTMVEVCSEEISCSVCRKRSCSAIG